MTTANEWQEIDRRIEHKLDIVLKRLDGMQGSGGTPLDAAMIREIIREMVNGWALRECLDPIPREKSPYDSLYREEIAPWARVDSAEQIPVAKLGESK